MPRILLTLGVLALAGAGQAVWGGDGDPSVPPWFKKESSVTAPVFDVPKVEKLVADGQPGDWGDRGFRVEVMREPSARSVAPEPFAPGFRLAWDERGLWVLASVRDLAGKTETHWPLGSLQIVVAERLGSPLRHRVDVFPDREEALRVRFQDGRLRALYDPRLQSEELRRSLSALVAAVRTEDGYRIEVLLPWEDLGFSVKPDREIAFALNVTSAPGAGGKDAKGLPVTLSGSWCPDPQSLHLIRLAAKASPPVEKAVKYASSGHTPPPSHGSQYGNENCSLYIPQGIKQVRGVYVSLPNYDTSTPVSFENGASYAVYANRAFVERMNFALMGMTYVDHIEGKSTFEIPAAERLQQWLRDFAKDSQHPELESVPLIVDGFSQFSKLTLDNLVAKMPERIIAFGASGGCVTDGRSVSEASRQVPGVLHVGEKNEHCALFKAVFAANRQAVPPAPWSLTLGPGQGDRYGKRSYEQCQHLILSFYASMIQRRMPADYVPGMPVKLIPVDQQAGWLGDPGTLQIAPYATFGGDKTAANWFPDRYLADVWRHFSQTKEINMQDLQRILTVCGDRP